MRCGQKALRSGNVNATALALPLPTFTTLPADPDSDSDTESVSPLFQSVRPADVGTKWKQMEASPAFPASSSPPAHLSA